MTLEVLNYVSILFLSFFRHYLILKLINRSASERFELSCARYTFFGSLSYFVALLLLLLQFFSCCFLVFAVVVVLHVALTVTFIKLTW